MLRRGERAQRLTDAKEKRKAAEAFAESVHLQAKIKEIVAEHMHRQQCDPMGADSYAHKTAIARALGMTTEIKILGSQKCCS